MVVSLRNKEINALPLSVALAILQSASPFDSVYERASLFKQRV
jgi:hypothetical protein